jgi:peptidoglycan/LPS O-acetylase OafA/YrhL
LQGNSLPATEVTGTKATTETTPNKSRLPELDGLRGIAIALVLIYHYFYFAPAPDHHPAEWFKRAFDSLDQVAALGWSGVDLFFVLSGFLIGGILLDARGSPNYFKTFYARRVFRILPIYYAWIGAYIVVMAVAGHFLEARIARASGWEAGSAIAAQFFFLQNLYPHTYLAIGEAWFLPTWSLAVEEQFYLIAPAVVRFVTRSRLYLFLGFVILSAPLLRIYVRHDLPPLPNELSLAYMLMPCRADALAIGVLAALLWRNCNFQKWVSGNVRVLPIGVGVFFAGVAILTKWAPDHDSLAEQSGGYTWIAIFYALILLLVLSNPSGWVAGFTRMAWLRELGKVSYCVYLIHQAVAMFCHLLLVSVLQRSTAWQSIAMSCAAILVTYAIARASWTLFESPLLQKGHKYKY